MVIFKYFFSISHLEFVAEHDHLVKDTSSSLLCNQMESFHEVLANGSEQKWYVPLLGCALKGRKPDLLVPSFFPSNLLKCRVVGDRRW